MFRKVKYLINRKACLGCGLCVVKGKMVLSKDDIRIVHLESANVIAALFFDQKRNEKQDILLKMIENSFINREISPLGIVWLCNGSGRHSKFSWRLESILLTERIVENVSIRLYEIHTSEEIRKLLYLLDKITISDKKETGIKLDWKTVLIKPLIAATLCGVAAWGANYVITTYFAFGSADSRLNSDTLGCIISIIIAVVVYATCILVSKTIVKDDILMLPKGEKIAEILEKYKLLG